MFGASIVERLISNISQYVEYSLEMEVHRSAQLVVYGYGTSYWLKLSLTNASREKRDRAMTSPYQTEGIVDLVVIIV